MRRSPLNPTFHSTNRSRLAKSIGEEAIAIIDTADVLTRAGDYEYPFHPDSNFYYLTGIDEPQSVLVLIPGHANPDLREMLFISGTSEFVGTWEGDRLTPGEATKLSGIKSVHDLDDLSFYLDRALDKYQQVYLNAQESLESHMSSPSLRRAKWLRDRKPTHQLRSALPQLTKQRMIKEDCEIQQLKRAIQITDGGLRAAYMALRPGAKEYELEAALTSHFISMGAVNAYMPIVAAGKNATTIHHMKNDGLIGESDLVLMDVGAEVGYYAADITRTVPASGHFSPRARAVYDALLRLQSAAYGLLKPGCNRADYEKKIQDLLVGELEALGIKKPNPRKYMPHATTHYLGLDLHDLADYSAPMTAGMVMMVEPGIYLKEEGIGIRLEDVVLITETGCEVLSKSIPSDPDEIEEIIQKGQK